MANPYIQNWSTSGDLAQPVLSGYKLGSLIRQRRRDEELNNILKAAYQPGQPARTEIMPNDELGIEFQRPATPGGLNFNNAIAAMYQGGFGKEAMTLQQQHEQNEIAKLLKQAQIAKAMGTIPGQSPSNVREWEYFKQLQPDQQDMYLRMKRADKFLDTGSGYVVPSPAKPTTVSPVVNRGLKPSEELSYIEDKKTTEKRAEGGVKKEMLFPKARDTMTSLTTQWKVVDDTINKALTQISPFSAGVGSWFTVFPATQAKDLQRSLETIKANVGFDKLQDMRNNSPTGGALGQVSEFENRLLQSVNSSMEQDQSPQQLIENLKRVQTDLRNLKEAKELAFQTDYAGFLNKQPTQPEQPAAPIGAVQPQLQPGKTIEDGFIYMGGDPGKQESWKPLR